MPESGSLEILVETTEDCLSVTLNRPEASNALSPTMVEALIQTFASAGHPALCVIKGAGKNFCAGFDLSDLDGLSDGDLLWRFLRIETLLQMVHHAPYPVVACAQGHVIGAGADLFAACWHRMAAPDARFKMPGWNFELALGTRRLARLVGTDAARDLLIDTKTVGTPEAVTMGLVSEIVDQETWDRRVTELLARCSGLPQNSKAQMLALTIADTRDEDIAAIVQTAGRPGLKDRIKAYQAKILADRKARRQGAKHD